MVAELLLVPVSTNGEVAEYVSSHTAEGMSGFIWLFPMSQQAGIKQVREISLLEKITANSIIFMNKVIY